MNVLGYLGASVVIRPNSSFAFIETIETVKLCWSQTDETSRGL